MQNILSTILAPATSDASYSLYATLTIICLILMAISAIAVIVLVIIQQGNSSGIDALNGSSETFFGKNKGKSAENKLKKITYIALGVLVVLAIIFFILRADVVWGIKS